MVYLADATAGKWTLHAVAEAYEEARATRATLVKGGTYTAIAAFPPDEEPPHTLPKGVILFLEPGTKPPTEIGGYPAP